MCIWVRLTVPVHRDLIHFSDYKANAFHTRTIFQISIRDRLMWRWKENMYRPKFICIKKRNHLDKQEALKMEFLVIHGCRPPGAGGSWARWYGVDVASISNFWYRKRSGKILYRTWFHARYITERVNYLLFQISVRPHVPRIGVMCGRWRERSGIFHVVVSLIHAVIDHFNILVRWYDTYE